MAEDHEKQSLASTFPNPPAFWQSFTPDSISHIDELRKAHGSGASEYIAGVPEELVNLQPPAEPKDGTWRVFGDSYTLDDKLPTLESQSITNLPATHPSYTAAPASRNNHYDHALELKRLTKSLLLNFLELTGSLSTNPTHGVAKVDDLRTLLINIHHALNEYRPHQAREQAAEMMMEHLDRIRGETVAVRSQVDRARRVLEGLGSLGIEEDEDAKMGKDDDEGQGGREREREIWGVVDAIFA